MSNTLSENSHIIKLAHINLFKTNLPLPREKEPTTASMGFSEAGLASAASKLLPQGPIITAHHSAPSAEPLPPVRTVSFSPGLRAGPPSPHHSRGPPAMGAGQSFPRTGSEGAAWQGPPCGYSGQRLPSREDQRAAACPRQNATCGLSLTRPAATKQRESVYVYVSRS